eukprot:409574-Ditylum_brightwellii.AAC.1
MEIGTGGLGCKWGKFPKLHMRQELWLPVGGNEKGAPTPKVPDCRPDAISQSGNDLEGVGSINTEILALPLYKYLYYLKL